MEFYKFWARENAEVSTPRGQRAVTAVGWSNRSAEEAQAMAQKHLARSRERILISDPPREESYGYGDGRILREEIVQTLEHYDGSPLATITRNNYGCLVLNTQRVLFIDLDFETLPAAKRSFWQRLTGQALGTQEEQALAHVNQIAEGYPQWSFRVYRTQAGLRVVLLSTLVNATEPVWLEMLERFGSDPLYVKLCKTQESFRARLTPKAWRCEYSRPWARFPYATDAERGRFQRWLTGYHRVCKTFGTCHLLTTLGPEKMPQGVEAVLKLHDDHALRAELPLG